VKPVADHFPRHNGSGFAHKDKEGGLEGVFGMAPILSTELRRPVIAIVITAT
jgi:hypothetical protein